MERTVTLNLRTPNPDDLIAIWYRLWSHPAFRGNRAEVRTENLLDDGYLTLPSNLPPALFEALIRGMRPTSFVCTTSMLDAQLTLTGSRLYISALNEKANGLFDLVKKHVMSMKAPDALKRYPIDYEMRSVQNSFGSNHWVENLFSVIRRNNLKPYVLKKGEGLLTDVADDGAELDLIAAFDDNRFICYDFVNDRLIGCKVTNPLQKG